jgi:hypothetical protein
MHIRSKRLRLTSHGREGRNACAASRTTGGDGASVVVDTAGPRASTPTATPEAASSAGGDGGALPVLVDPCGDGDDDDGVDDGVDDLGRRIAGR